MESENNSLNEEEKQSTRSMLNVFNNLFVRDRSASSDVDMPVLTSFKELPDAADAVEVCKTNSKGALQETTKTTCEQVEKSRKVSESDLVQVTRVETYSDTENEDNEKPKNSTAFSEKPDVSQKAALSKEGNDVMGHGKGDEPKIPVFRTHGFRDRSTIEAILYSSKFGRKGRSNQAKLPSVSKPEDGGNVKSSPTKESVIAESTEDSAKLDVATTSVDDEYDSIDCSKHVPSVISGNQTIEAPFHERDGINSIKLSENMVKADEPQPNQIPEKIIQSSSKPGEQLKTFDLTRSGPKVPSDSTGNSQSSVSSSVQHIPDPKTPEASAASPVSSAATSSPSRGASLSSPPSFQMPALFSGLRVLKKGAVGEDREMVSEIKQREKDAELALLSLKKTVNKAKLLPEQKMASSVKKPTEPKSLATSKSTTLGQLTQRLNLDNNDDTNKSTDGKKSEDGNEGGVEGKKPIKNGEGDQVSVETNNRNEVESLKSSPEKKKTSDLAYETFKNIFGPKTVKKENGEDVDLDVVKKKLKNDKESLRSIFERTSKSPAKDITSSTEATVCPHCIFYFLLFFCCSCCFALVLCTVLIHAFACFFFYKQTEVSPTDSEDRTPGRLQAVWPPPKPKDEEEKVGLKYTEAGKTLRLVGLCNTVFVCF